MNRLYRIVLDRGWWVIALLTLAGAVWCVTKLDGLGIEFQTRTLLDQSDRELAEYEAKHETTTWSENEFAVVCLSGRDWISEGGIKILRKFVSDLNVSPNVGSTMSLLDIPMLRQQPDQKPNLLAMAAGLTKLKDADKPVNWDAAREEFLHHELVAGTLIAKDGKSLNILVYLAKPEPNDARDTQTRWQVLVHGLHDLAAKWNGRLPSRVRLNGVPVIYTYIIERVAHDLRIFGVGAAILFSLALLVIYKNVRFVVLPLVTSVLPVIFILGWMAVNHIAFTVITSNLPLLLFVLSLPYTIYVAERYLERRAAAPSESQADSITGAASSMWIPCFFSALTSMAGFGAFTTSGILPVQMFGKMMVAGTAVSLAVVFLFFPAVQQRLRPSTVRTGTAATRKRDLAGLFAKLALARPRSVVVASVIVLGLGIAGALRITAENKFTSYFWPSSQVYQDIEFVDQKLGGTSPLEIYLTSEQDGYFRTPEGLAAVAAVERFYSDIPQTGSVRTLTSLTREMRKTFKREWFPTMEDAFLLQVMQGQAPELFHEIMNEKGTMASIQARMQETSPTLNRRAIINALDRHIESLRNKELKGLRIETTGIFVLYANMLESLIQSQKDTLWFVIAAIFLMLLILFRSPVLAVLVLLPQSLPAVTMLGIMGWCHIPLDLVTVMIAAIALGVGVDSAIQYTMRFRSELAVDGDPRAALSRSHATVGRAIWIATSVIVLGFAVLMASDFFPSVWFGLFTGLAMLMSQFSALITLPALFLLTGRPRPPVGAGAAPMKTEL